MKRKGRDYALEARGLCRRSGEGALEGVDFAVPFGSVTALTGEPAGDRTLILELLLGIKRKSAGVVRILGEDPERAGASLAGGTGVVLSRSALPSSLTPGELSRVMAGIYRRWSDRTFMQLLRRFTLPDGIRTDRYSAAMRAKLALAAALSHEARLLLLDEPVKGVDERDRDEMLECILDFKSGGGSVLIATGDLDTIDSIADGIVLLHGGRALLSEDIGQLGEEYALLELPAQRLSELDGRLLAGVRARGEYVEALVHRADFSGFELKPAGVRDVIAFCTGEGESS